LIRPHRGRRDLLSSPVLIKRRSNLRHKRVLLRLRNRRLRGIRVDSKFRRVGLAVADMRLHSDFRLIRRSCEIEALPEEIRSRSPAALLRRVAHRRAARTRVVTAAMVVAIGR
jgi:hypothetical protein